MATVFIDGFDKYGIASENSPTVSALLTLNGWSLTGGSFTISSGLSSNGYAITLNASFNPNNGIMTKVLPASYSRAIGGVRIKPDLANAGHAVTFLDTTNAAQCCITWSSLGFQVRTAGTGGTVLGQSTGNIASLSTHYLEWDITIGASASYTVYLDGQQIITGTGDTRGGTTNNRYHSIQLVPPSGVSGNSTFDDLYVFDTTTAVNNAVLRTNPRIETRYPSSDSQTQLTNNGNVLLPFGITQTGVSNSTSTTNAAGANQLVLLKIVANVTCSLQSIGILPASTSAGAKFKAVLYTDSAGSPNSLTATGTEVVGATSGTVLSLPFSGGQSLTASTSYWIGYITDTSVSLSLYDSSTLLGQKAANTYVSGAPATAPAMTTIASMEIWGNATGATTNWESVAGNPASAITVGNNSNISSNTQNREDLYGYPALSTTAAAVYTIGMKSAAKKSDNGIRQVDLRMKSSASDAAGNNASMVQGAAAPQIPTSTANYNWIESHFDTDPNGGVAWTGTTANAATAGPKIAF